MVHPQSNRRTVRMTVSMAVSMTVSLTDSMTVMTVSMRFNITFRKNVSIPITKVSQNYLKGTLKTHE